MGKDLNWVEETYTETIPCGWQVIKGDNRRIWALRTGEWKLIYYDFPGNEQGGYYELFNLANDRGERVNLLEKEEEKFIFLKKKLNKWVSEAVSLDIV